MCAYYLSVVIFIYIHTYIYIYIYIYMCVCVCVYTLYMCNDKCVRMCLIIYLTCIYIPILY